MFLVAVSQQDNGTVEFEAPDSGEFTLGMLPAEDGRPGIVTGPMCRLISRQHSRARVEGEMLVLERLASGRHPYVHPDTLEELPDRLSLYPGDRFQIHPRGKVVFHWVRDPSLVTVKKVDDSGSSTPAAAALDGGAVAQLGEGQVREALNVLQHDLPMALSSWSEPRDLYVRVARFLTHKVPGNPRLHVRFVALPAGDDGDEASFADRIRQLSGDDGVADGFVPRADILQSLVDSGDAAAGRPQVTRGSAGRIPADEDDDAWIVAVPLGVRDGDDANFATCRDLGDPVCLYVESAEAGAGPEVALPFLNLLATLTAQLIGARENRLRNERLGGFLSRRVREIVMSGNLTALEPVNRDCTVLFCDRWGSSKAAESGEESDEARLARLAENRRLLDLMARAVEASDGTVADFAGDGLLAFWGWPDGPGVETHAWAAVEAAVWLIGRVAAEAQAEGAHDFSQGFPVRIGINTGTVAVGQIGPPSQFKIGVFGDVVNVSSRLEGLGKAFRVPVLLSASTAAALHAVPPPREALGEYLIRRLCRMVPKGMTRPTDIHELVLPREMGGTGIDARHQAIYEEALAAFEERRWKDCLRSFDDLRTSGDPAAQLIRRLAEDYDRGHSPPAEGWHGEINATEK